MRTLDAPQKSRPTIVLPRVAANGREAIDKVFEQEKSISGREVVVDIRRLVTASEGYVDTLAGHLKYVRAAKVLVHGTHPDFVEWFSRRAKYVELEFEVYDAGKLPADPASKPIPHPANRITFGDLLHLAVNGDGSVTIDLPHGVLVERTPRMLVIRRDENVDSR